MPTISKEKIYTILQDLSEVNADNPESPHFSVTRPQQSDSDEPKRDYSYCVTPACVCRDDNTRTVFLVARVDLSFGALMGGRSRTAMLLPAIRCLMPEDMTFLRAPIHRGESGGVYFDKAVFYLLVNTDVYYDYKPPDELRPWRVKVVAPRKRSIAHELLYLQQYLDCWPRLRSLRSVKSQDLKAAIRSWSDIPDYLRRLLEVNGGRVVTTRDEDELLLPQEKLLMEIIRRDIRSRDLYRNKKGEAFIQALADDLQVDQATIVRRAEVLLSGVPQKPDIVEFLEDLTVMDGCHGLSASFAAFASLVENRQDLMDLCVRWWIKWQERTESSFGPLSFEMVRELIERHFNASTGVEEGPGTAKD
jgi:hypothetical protein